MNASTIALRGEKLTRKFGELTAVDRLDLDVRAGEIFGFLGPNGAGKTTSIRMMTGLLKPTSGRVLVGDDEIRSNSNSVKKRIGVCPQDIVVWEKLTCLENVVLMGRMFDMAKIDARERAVTLLDHVGLSPKSGTRAANLSGGMQKRLNLVMALIHDPEIIVLDEPITGLDPQSRLLVSEFIRDLSREQGKTVILTTHMMEVAEKLSDRIAIMDHGKLLALDTLSNLKKTTGNGDIVELSVKGGTDADAVLNLVAEIAGVESAGIHEGRVRFQAGDAINLLPDISRKIDALGGRIDDLSLHGNTLEDIFIYLTGRNLRD
jgi:ABC-2 type transport system ATP-binding protein